MVEKLVAAVKKLIAAVKKLVAAWSKKLVAAVGKCLEKFEKNYHHNANFSQLFPNICQISFLNFFLQIFHRDEIKLWGF